MTDAEWVRDEFDVELVPLCDGKISVRVEGKEVGILPRRDECKLSDLTKAIRAVIVHVGLACLHSDGDRPGGHGGDWEE